MFSCCSIAESCWLRDFTDCSTAGSPVLPNFQDFAQIHVQKGDATQPSHPLSSPSPPAFSLSQHQGLFQWVNSASGGQSIGALASSSVLPVAIQDWSPLGWTGMISLLSRDSQESSPASQFESIDSLVLRLLYGPNLTSVHDYWKNHSFNYKELCWQSDVSAFYCAV